MYAYYNYDSDYSIEQNWYVVTQNLLKELRENYRDTVGNRRYGSQRFSLFWTRTNSKIERMMLKETEVTPCQVFHEWYLEFTQRYEKDANDRFLAFVQQHTQLLNELRFEVLKLKIEDENLTIDIADENLKEKILELNLIERRRPMNIKELRHALYPFLLENPQTMTWEEIRNMHERDVHKTESVILDGTDNWSTVSPWKSRGKVERYGKSRGWTGEQIDTNVNRDGADRFDMKKQRKLMTHYVAPRYSFVMDYFFAGRFQYCLMININTRKAFYAIPREIQRLGTHYQVPEKKFKATITSAVQSLRELMQQTPIRNLIMDNEPAWTSKTFQKFLNDNGIGYRFVTKNDFGGIIETHEEKRLNHSSTALVDRLIRTLRMMNYNLGNSYEIQPNVMEMLINEYNNSPHATLSKYLKRPATPNEVDEDYQLERKIVSELARENMIVRSSSEYQLAPYVRVFNQASRFDKVKPKLLPGHWKVVGTDNGLIELEQNGTRIKVTRWMIKSD